MDPKLNTDLMSMCLADARVAIDRLLQELKNPALDHSDAGALAVHYELLLYNIALSWHAGWLTSEQFRQLSSAEYRRLGNQIPNFGFEFTLTNDIVR
jgi:hypothetical protein